MEWPIVVFVIPTFNRIDDLEKTVLALHYNVHYPIDRTLWVIADDSSPGDYAGQVISIWERNGLPSSMTFICTDHNGGFGYNVNNALSRFRDYTVFFCEGDYVLNTKLDLMAGVALLRKVPRIGMLRYRGTAGSRMIYHQDEADITNMYPDYWSSEGAQGKLTYLEIVPESPTLYLYSNGPHLKAPSFHQYYGLYPEGFKLGKTEEMMAHIVKDGMAQENAPRIAILPDFVETRFTHIGVSFQHTEFDKGAE